MIDLAWLSDRLVEVLRAQLAHDPNAPEIPMAGQRVWGIFLDLHAARSSNGFGVNPISYGEIESWSRLHREPVRSFELDMLRALDVAYLKAAAEMAKEPDKPNVSAEKLTPALFNRLFGDGKRRGMR